MFPLKQHSHKIMKTLAKQNTPICHVHDEEECIKQWQISQGENSSQSFTFFFMLTRVQSLLLSKMFSNTQAKTPYYLFNTTQNSGIHRLSVHHFRWSHDLSVTVKNLYLIFYPRRLATSMGVDNIWKHSALNDGLR